VNTTIRPMCEGMPSVQVLRDWLIEQRSLTGGALCPPAYLDEAGMVYALGEFLGAPHLLLEQAWAEMAWTWWRTTGATYFRPIRPNPTNATTWTQWRTA
jgi:hypothetical protein